MPRNNIGDILGLEEGEPLIRKDLHEKKFEKRMKKVAEYKKIAESRKRVDWNKIMDFTPSPNPGLEPCFNQSRYRLKRLKEIPQNIAEYFNNMRNYFHMDNEYMS